MRWEIFNFIIKIRGKMINNKKIKQQGFSLVELMIVLAIISTLTIIVLVAGGKMFSSKQEIITDTAIAIPSAVSVCAKLHRGDLTTCNKSSLMRKVQTLEEKTACGDTWTIAASATEVVLTYPLTSCSDADDIGSEVIEYVKELPRISTDISKTKYVSKSLQITYLIK
jgi:prepilin-type N-terminal cleavage/methylation domain-containing protein